MNDDRTVRDIGRRPTRLAEVNGQDMGLPRFTPNAWTFALEGRQVLSAEPIGSSWAEADSADDSALHQAQMDAPQPLRFTGFPLFPHREP